MRSRCAFAGIAALAFSVLTIVGLLLSEPPGGTYSAHDAEKYIARGHHVAVFVAVYLLLLATFSLIWLLAYLREVGFAASSETWVARLFWGTGLCAAASLAVGWSLMLGVAMSTAFGGHSVTLAPNVTYVLVEVGSTAIWGAGAFLLGLALIAFSLAATAVFPAWLRVATAVAGIGGITGVAFFPSGLLLLWGIAVGLWLVFASRRVADPAVAPAGV
jgi:hypothetical protein